MFQGKRSIEQYTMKIGARPETIFPLLCPEREKEWIDGWTYEMIYSKSGVAELGCVWKTDLPDEGEACWVMTKCVSPKEGEYVRFVAGLMVVSLLLQLREQADGTTSVVMTHTFTGLSEQGNQVIATKIPAGYKQQMQRLEASLNHFVSTGCLLKV